MILTIDTDRSLHPADRAILRALLDDTTPDTEPRPSRPHEPTHTTTTSARIQDQIRATTPDTGTRASMKLPISQQPGVTTTPSTREETSQPE